MTSHHLQQLHCHCRCSCGFVCGLASLAEAQALGDPELWWPQSDSPWSHWSRVKVGWRGTLSSSTLVSTVMWSLFHLFVSDTEEWTPCSCGTRQVEWYVNERRWAAVGLRAPCTIHRTNLRTNLEFTDSVDRPDQTWGKAMGTAYFRER